MPPLELKACVFHLTCAIQKRSQHNVVYKAFAHDAQDLWKASYGYLRFSQARGEGTERLQNTDTQSYKQAADCAVQPVE